MKIDKVIKILRELKGNHEVQYDNEQELVPYVDEVEALTMAIDKLEQHRDTQVDANRAYLLGYEDGRQGNKCDYAKLEW